MRRIIVGEADEDFTVEWIAKRGGVTRMFFIKASVVNGRAGQPVKNNPGRSGIGSPLRHATGGGRRAEDSCFSMNAAA